MRKKGKRVYSTGPHDSRSERPEVEREKPEPASPGSGAVYLARDRRGRGGKTVTVITGLPLGEAARRSLLKRLKSMCGAGGTVKGAALELQGDHRERLKGVLEREGYQVKLKGG